MEMRELQVTGIKETVERINNKDIINYNGTCIYFAEDYIQGLKEFVNLLLDNGE